MKYRGSRRHILEWLDQPTFVQEMNELLRPLPVALSSGDIWVPKGSALSKETTIEAFGEEYAPDLAEWSRIRGWWLADANRGKTPTWDLISTCTVALTGASTTQGILLVEAKANMPELSSGGKRLLGRRIGGKGSPLLPPSDEAKANHDAIGRAIAQASEALVAVGMSQGLSAASHYQLANRLALSWKLARMGVPVILVYLGFCGDHGLVDVGEPLACAEHWCSVFRFHCSSRLLVPEGMTEVTFQVSLEQSPGISNVPVWIALRARDVLSQSPPVAV